MKYIAFFLLLFASSLRGSEPSVIGEWSAPVKGLRGRLLFSEEAPFNGTRMAVIYLELQNVLDVLNPVLVDFHEPRFGLVDSSGKSVPQSPSACSILTPPPYTLVLPYDSTLRFRVSVSGYGIAKDGGIALQFASEFWLISKLVHEDRFLTGSFAVPALAPGDIEGERKDNARGHGVWRGALDLPKLKIPRAD